MKVRSKSIPVIIDDVKYYEKFKMTRCVYYNVESDLPSPNWVLDHDRKRIPLYIYNLSGIIYKPFGKKIYFNTSDLIKDYFRKIDKIENIYIDMNDIWLPNKFFSKYIRGSVYRIKEKLFLKAYMFREGRISLEDFLDICDAMSEKMVFYSEEETRAFKEWSDHQIDDAKKLYQKREKLALKYLTE